MHAGVVSVGGPSSDSKVMLNSFSIAMKFLLNVSMMVPNFWAPCKASAASLRFLWHTCDVAHASQLGCVFLVITSQNFICNNVWDLVYQIESEENEENLRLRQTLQYFARPFYIPMNMHPIPLWSSNGCSYYFWLPLFFQTTKCQWYQNFVGDGMLIMHRLYAHWSIDLLQWTEWRLNE